MANVCWTLVNTYVYSNAVMLQIITSVGGYSALFMCIQAHVNPGDEVCVYTAAQ